jgi:chromosome segregation ATPase
MPRTIATASNVFAACDRLEAANERWNREDVRTEVGGGGWVVIDPLIKAWRALRPLREVAPSTPAELLQQVAASLETHIAGFTEEAESRLTESQKIFDTTVSELSEKLAKLETELEEKTASLASRESGNAELTEQLEQAKTELEASRTENARLMTENDGLTGQVSRMEKEHKTTIQSMQTEQRELLKQHAKERSRVAKEHATAIAVQRKELAHEAEQAENRLMVLLDQERQEAKENESKLSDNLEKIAQKAQSQRDTIVALEISVTELTRQNEELDSELAARVESNTVLQISLEEQKAVTTSIEQEFTAYKQQHALGGELGALQDAVAGLQAQLTERKKKTKG